MTDLDRVTDLFEKWAAEENEHRQTGEYGLAEGLRVAIDDLRAAVHGITAVPSDHTATTEDADLRDRLQEVIAPVVAPYTSGPMDPLDLQVVDAVVGLLATARPDTTEMQAQALEAAAAAARAAWAPQRCPWVGFLDDRAAAIREGADQ